MKIILLAVLYLMSMPAFAGEPITLRLIGDISPDAKPGSPVRMVGVEGGRSSCIYYGVVEDNAGGKTIYISTRVCPGELEDAVSLSAQLNDQHGLAAGSYIFASPF